jgi:hypothetical protein
MITDMETDVPSLEEVFAEVATRGSLRNTEALLHLTVIASELKLDCTPGDLWQVLKRQNLLNREQLDLADVSRVVQAVRELKGVTVEEEAKEEAIEQMKDAPVEDEDEEFEETEMDLSIFKLFDEIPLLSETQEILEPTLSIDFIDTDVLNWLNN